MNKVTINAFDQDNIVISGSVVYIVSTSARFNGFFRTAGADLSQFKFLRYFEKSGTYKIRVLYLKDTNAGKLDMGINKLGSTTNTTNLINQLDTYNGSTTYNNIYETTISIARGINEINFKANGKNASSSNYYIYFSLVEIIPIDEHPVLGEDGIAQINQGSMVLLGHTEVTIAQTNMTINLADATKQKYSSFLIKFAINPDGIGDLQATVNEVTSAYFKRAIANLSGVVGDDNHGTAAQWTLFTALASGAQAVGEILIDGSPVVGDSSDNRLYAKFDLRVNVTDFITGTLQQNTVNTIQKFTKFVLKMSANNFKIGSKMTIYGIKGFGFIER